MIWILVICYLCAAIGAGGMYLVMWLASRETMPYRWKCHNCDARAIANDIRLIDNIATRHEVAHGSG